MANTKTVLIAAAAAGIYLFARAKKEVANTIAGLTFRITPADWPRLIGLTQIEIPLRVQVSNVGFVDLPLQGLNFQIERINRDGSTYQFAATPPEGVPTSAIKARSTTTLIIPVRTEPLVAIAEAWTTFQKRGMNRFRATGTFQAAGLSIPIPATPFNL